jgi:uncharacterized cupin superfamily protein
VTDGVSTTRLDPGSSERMTMLSEQLGLTSLGLRQIVLQPGQRNRVHRHRDQEEVYVVLGGRLTIVLDDGERELGEGEVARVAPQLRRQLANRSEEPCVVLAIGAAGTHERGDAEAFFDWDDIEPKSPQDVPLPE